MVNIVELFAGIGAIRKALEKENVKHKTLFYSEIEPNAIKAYRAIFNDNETRNLGDIAKIQEQDLKPYKNKVDLLFLGSPCQDFSQGGFNRGGEKNSQTRSSLIWEGLRIIKILKPKIVIFENVKNLLMNHYKIVRSYKSDLRKIGYHNKQPLLLNSLSFGVPQNRERVFIVSYLHKQSINNNKFRKLKNLPIDNYPPLKQYLNIHNFDERHLLKEKIKHRKWKNFSTWTAKSGNINGSYNRAWKIEKYCGTLSVCNVIKITDDELVSKITPLESCLLMGFTQSDYENITKELKNENMIYSLMGNSIVVDVLEGLIKCLK